MALLYSITAKDKQMGKFERRNELIIGFYGHFTIISHNISDFMAFIEYFIVDFVYLSSLFIRIS